jgi:hypothetical protein
MSTSVTLASTAYAVPAVGETGWGTELTNYLVAIAADCLAKKGGTFTLLADVDFGANYGLKSTYYKSRGTNLATAGVIRLASAETIQWRNNANNANLSLTTDSSDRLLFGGNILPTLGIGSAYNALVMNSGGTAFEWSKITNNHVDTSAAIARTKLAAGTADHVLIHDGSGVMSSEAALSAARGGTGVANNAAATLTRSGNHALTFTTTGTTSLTLPTGGTVMSTTSTETITGSAVKTFDSSTTLAVQGLLDMRASDYANLRIPSSALYLYKDDDSQFGYFVASALTATRSWTLQDASGTVALTSNKLSAFAATTSAELAGVISDETGTGSLVFATSPTIRGDLLLQNTSGAQPTLQLSEDPYNGTNKVTLKAPASLAADYALTLPTDDGLAGQTIVTDGSGVLSWSAAAGAGELNLIDNPSDASNWSSTGWSNAAATTTAAGDLPLSGVIDTAIQITSDTSAGTEAAEYVSYSFTTPASMAAKLKVEFWMRPGSNFTSSEWTVSVYQSTTRQSLSTDSSSVTYLPNAAGKFTTTFDCAASTAYTLRFARPVNAGANAGVLNVANVVVGPGTQPQGAVVTGEMAYTPTFTGLGTSTNISVKWRRVGENLLVDGVATTGTTDGTTASISLPTGLTTTNPITRVVGKWWRNNASATTRKGGTLYVTTTAGLTVVYFGSDDYTTAHGPVSGGGGSTFLGTSEIFYISFSVSINEWAGSGTLNVARNDVEFAADDGSADVFGPNGTLVPNQAAATGVTERTFSFQVAPQTTDSIVLEIKLNGMGWSAVGDLYPFHSGNNASSSNFYGIRGFWASATTYTVQFGNQGNRVAASNADAGTASWATENAAGTRWRARKVSSGQAVGFGNVAQSSSGLVKSAGQLLGTNTNDSAATGYVGEYVANTRSSASPAITSATYCSIDSGNATFNDNAETGITLTAGDWDIQGTAYFTTTGAVAMTYLILFIGTQKGTNTSGLVVYENYYERQLTWPNGADETAMTPTWRVSISATTTYYLKCRVTWTGGTSVTAQGTIRARRVR